MRSLVISDTHLGAWTGDDLLAYAWAREPLRPELERADEVVLLGVFVDLLFATLEHAFERANGFVELLAQTLAGKRLVWLAGNHDHHILVRRLESADRAADRDRQTRPGARRRLAAALLL